MSELQHYAPVMWHLCENPSCVCCFFDARWLRPDTLVWITEPSCHVKAEHLGGS